MIGFMLPEMKIYAVKKSFLLSIIVDMLDIIRICLNDIYT